MALWRGGFKGDWHNAVVAGLGDVNGLIFGIAGVGCWQGRARKARLAANEDEQTVEQLDPGAKNRTEIQEDDLSQKTTDDSKH